MEEKKYKRKKWNTEIKTLIEQGVSNFVWSLDFTKIGEHDSLLCILNINSRKILAHCFLENIVTVSHVLETLQGALSFYKEKNVKIVHSDRQPLFKEPVYIEFLDSNKIEMCWPSSKRNENQRVERAFRTLKDFLKIKFFSDMCFNNCTNYKEKAQFIKQLFEFYNNKSHKGLSKMTPNYMEDLLLSLKKSTNIIEYKQVHSLDKALVNITRTEDSQKKSIIENQFVPSLAKNAEFKALLINEFLKGYIGDSRKALNDIASHLNIIIKQNFTLYQQNLALKKQINFVEAEFLVMKERPL